MHIDNFAGNLGDLVGIQTKAALAGQHFTRKLENNSLIHTFSSIA